MTKVNKSGLAWFELELPISKCHTVCHCYGLLVFGIDVIQIPNFCYWRLLLSICLKWETLVEDFLVVCWFCYCHEWGIILWATTDNYYFKMQNRKCSCLELTHAKTSCYTLTFIGKLSELLSSQRLKSASVLVPMEPDYGVCYDYYSYSVSLSVSLFFRVCVFFQRPKKTLTLFIVALMSE